MPSIRPAKSAAQHVGDAEALAKRFGAVPNRAWLMANGYATLYNFMSYHSEKFEHLKKYAAAPRRNGRLSAEQVKKIRGDPRSSVKIAAAYNLSRQYIISIRNREAYKYVSE